VLEQQVETFLFLAAPLDILPDSTVYKRVQTHYDLATITPEVIEIINECYLEHLHPFIPTFAALRSQLPEKSPFWSKQAELFDDAVLKGWKEWYKEAKSEFSEDYQVILELFPTRFKAVSAYFRSSAPQENMRLVIYSGFMMLDTLKLLEGVEDSLRLVSLAPLSL
jgi:hypothetical protein